MKITINGTQVRFLPNSVSVNNSQNDFSAMFMVINTPILIGTECKIYNEDDILIASGIVYVVEDDYINYNEVESTVTVDSYRIRLESRNVSINRSYDQVTDIVNSFSSLLLEEGITIGNISNVVVESDVIKHECISMAALLDAVAQNTGNIWWIDLNKVLHVQPSMPIITTTKILTDVKTEVNRLKFITFPIIKNDITQYANKLFIVGEEYGLLTPVGFYQNNSEIATMQSRYGSGVYGRVETGRYIQTSAKGNLVAKALLPRYYKERTITFSTNDLLEINTKLKVELNKIGIDEYFIVESVIATYVGKTVYSVTLSRFVSDAEVMPKISNKEIMSKLLTTTKDTKSLTPDTFKREKSFSNPATYTITPSIPYYIVDDFNITRDGFSTRIEVNINGLCVGAGKLHIRAWTSLFGSGGVYELRIDAYRNITAGRISENVYKDLSLGRGNYSVMFEIAYDSDDVVLDAGSGAVIRVSSFCLMEGIGLIPPEPIPPEPAPSSLYMVANGVLGSFNFNSIAGESVDTFS